jgi:hypothetical protein
MYQHQRTCTAPPQERITSSTCKSRSANATPHARAHAHTHTHTQCHTHSVSHTHTRTHTHTHTHTHTCTHTRACVREEGASESGARIQHRANALASPHLKWPLVSSADPASSEGNAEEIEARGDRRLPLRRRDHGEPPA